MRLSRIVLSATLFTAIAGISSQASAQTCLAVSVRGGSFSCPGCLSPGAMPLQCSVHQCGQPAPAIDGWLLFSAGFSDFASAGSTCAGLGAAAWAGFASTPPTPPAPVAPVVVAPAPVAPAPAPVAPVVVGPTPVAPVVIRTGGGPPAPRVVIGHRPNSSHVHRTSKTTTVVVKSKRPQVHNRTKVARVDHRAKQPRHVNVVKRKHAQR